MSQRQDSTTFITILAAAELDIDELERRLELAPAVAAPPSWCSKDSCTYDCLSVCTLSGG